jgi:NAD+-dependent secondary alcohol dehydrogenase Adh1
MCSAASSMSITRSQHDEPGFPRPTGYGADHTVLADGSEVDKLLELTDGQSAEAVFDFSASRAPRRRVEPDQASRLPLHHRLRRHGQDRDHRHHLVRAEHRWIGNLVGTYNLVELMALAGTSTVTMRRGRERPLRHHRSPGHSPHS